MFAMKRLRVATLAAASLLLTNAWADVSPQDEYEKRLKLATTIQPLGETPFGETHSLLSGELGFQITDVELEGNGPAMRLCGKVRGRQL